MNADKFKGLDLDSEKGWIYIGVNRRAPQGGIKKNLSAVACWCCIFEMSFSNSAQSQRLASMLRRMRVSAAREKGVA